MFTTQEQNVIKDILKFIGRDESINSEFAAATGMTEEDFDNITESIFKKCENGRLTVIES